MHVASQTVYKIIRSHSAPPLTLSGSRVKCEVGSSRCHSKPPVPVRFQVLLKELLRLIVQDKGQVSSASLTPSLSTSKGSLQIHKLVAWAIETFLVFWAGLSFGIVLGVTTPAEEENHQSERSWSGSGHLWSWTLSRLSGSILFLKSNDVSSSDRDGFLDGCRALWCGHNPWSQTKPGCAVKRVKSSLSTARLLLCLHYCRASQPAQWDKPHSQTWCNPHHCELDLVQTRSS